MERATPLLRRGFLFWEVVSEMAKCKPLRIITPQAPPMKDLLTMSTGKLGYNVPVFEGEKDRRCVKDPRGNSRLSPFASTEFLCFR